MTEAERKEFVAGMTNEFFAWHRATMIDGDEDAAEASHERSMALVYQYLGNPEHLGEWKDELLAACKSDPRWVDNRCQ